MQQNLKSLTDEEKDEDPGNFNEERAAQYIGVDRATLVGWRKDRVGPEHYYWFDTIYYFRDSIDYWEKRRPKASLKSVP